MSVNLGSAHGTIEIGTAGAHSNILGLNNALGMVGQSMIGLNPVTLALGAGLIGLGAAFGGVAGAIDTSVDAADRLDTILDGVQANMQISAGEVSKLKDLVEDLSLDPNLKVSTFEAAEAIEMLGRNGLNVQEILDGAARSTVLLANATGGTFSQSADIATDVMALFGIEAKDMNTAVNGITSVVNNSKFAIGDYALALAQGGGVAAATGVEFEDFNTAIAGIAPLFASGSDAGTSFKTFLQRLVPQSKKAAGVMQDLGIITEDGANQFFDANGNMRDMADIAGLLQESLAGLSEAQRNDALSTIFGTDAMRAAVGLMELGEQGFNDLQTAMLETDAAMVAALRMDNLTGDLEILGGVIEALKIKIGDEWLPIFRQGTQGMTDFLTQHSDRIVGFFSDLADIVGQAIPVIRDFATQGLDYLLGFWDDISAAFEQNGLAGVFDTLSQYLADGWNNTIWPQLSQWATDFWAWATEATGDDTTLNGLLDSITTYLDENWPRISEALTRWSENFWQWAAEATAKVGEVLGPLVDEMKAWAESREAQQRLNALGQTLGGILLEAVGMALNNQAAADALLGQLVITLGQAAVNVAGSIGQIGASIGAGLIEGMIEGITGEDVSANVSAAIQGGVEGAVRGLAPLTAISDAYQYFVPPETAGQNDELLQEVRSMNSKLSGQANFVVNPDYLKDQGFINIQDYQGAYQ